MTQPAGRIGNGTTLAARRLTAVSGDAVPLPDRDRLVHLQFRRFAGCPVCDLHLRSMAARHDEIATANIRAVAVFHSSAEALRPYIADLPFAVIADPEKALYRAFGVEAAPRALLSPRAWLPIARAVGHALGNIRRGLPAPPSRVTGGRLGLPADFLIGRDGRVLAAKYGEHVYDQWDVDALLELALGAHLTV